MGQGTLKIDVQTADGALPVPGAQVTVAGPTGEALYHLTTDGSGQTGYVSLYAPDKSTALTPGGTAYAKYNVTVEKTGYITQIIEAATVFDALDSTQPVLLHPVYPGSEETETIVVPDNALKQDPGQVQQEGPSPLETRTLAQVGIPGYITVHLGVPSNAAARNVSVSFPNYVKNVTASEIYAEWPLASLEANIYAIISLALNRIYTEWYRSRGYNFDITNSTQYDQYFVEGRTIPDNISQIVDRLYNQYIRRVGFREPLFASFCNGTTATCAGMSQWGTVSLANAGYSTINILKRYYGNNIEIAQTSKIANVLTSYPGNPLSQGSSGAAVAQMQTYLNRIATNYPAIPKSTPDGQFGTTTAAAVRTFQRVFNLPQTGVINQATWNKITQIYVAVTRLAELDSEGQRIGLGVSPPTSTIRQGSRGGDVVQLQFLLNAIGAFYNSIPTPLLEDGSFGPTTANAVRAFQREFGLTADGVVGAGTWRKLYDVYKSLGIGTGTGGTGNPAYPGTPLRIGSRGSNVEFIQSLLNTLSDRYPIIPRISRDGVYGPSTAAAVTAFQRVFGLTPDGVVGPATWNAIVGTQSGLTPPVTPPTAPNYPGYVLREGSVGQNVKTLQTALNALADQYPSVPRVAVDGTFGPSTTASVMAAQRLLGLTADGIVGETSWNAIVKGEEPGTSVPPPRPFPGTLRQGSVGENVRILQIYLNRLAATHPTVPRVAEDGVFGPATRASVVAAQRALGLTPDGVVGPITWNAVVR